MICRLACLLVLAATAACAQTGPNEPPPDDPRAVAVVDKVCTRYKSIRTFYARYRQYNQYFAGWTVSTELLIWEELRKRPNMLWLETDYLQESPEDGLSAKDRLYGEEPPLVAPTHKDPQLRQARIVSNGADCWHEYYSLLAAAMRVGNGQHDTECMATQKPTTLAAMKEGDPWPSDPEPGMPIVVAELLDGHDVRARMVPGSLKLVTGKDADGKETLTEVAHLRTDKGYEERPSSHVAFLLDNGTEQHWWVDAETDMILAERVFQIKLPKKDPFQDPSPKVALPTGTELEKWNDIRMDRLARLRRYMTGIRTQADLVYEYLQWDFDIADGTFDYHPDEGIELVNAKDVSARLDQLVELTTGEPVRPSGGR